MLLSYILSCGISLEDSLSVDDDDVMLRTRFLFNW